MDNIEWKIGDVFTTTFWGVTEVCIIAAILPTEVVFIRLESIRRRKKIKKDFCAAGLETYLFNRIQKTFLHHSNWYSDYEQDDFIKSGNGFFYSPIELPFVKESDTTGLNQGTKA